MRSYSLFPVLFLVFISLRQIALAGTAPEISLDACLAPVIESSNPNSAASKVTIKVQDIRFSGCNNNSIDAYLVSPAHMKAGKYPAILYVHWYEPHAKNSNRNEFLQEARSMAEKGVVSLLVSTFWSVPGGSYHERHWQNDYQNTINQTQDLLQAIKLLQNFSYVDDARIVYVGHDYGATFGAIIAGLNTTLKGFALEAGTPRISEWYMYGSASGKPEGAEASQYLNSFKFIEPAAAIAKAKQPLLLQYARKDQFISEERTLEMKNAAPKNAEFKLYDTTHAMDLPEVEQDRRAWLIKILKLKKV